MPTDSPAAVVPRALKLAAAVVAAEGLVLVVLGIAEAFTIQSSRLLLGATTTIFFVLYGAGLGVVARGLSRAATWSRGPAVFAQLIQLLIAYSFWGGGTKGVAAALALTAAGVLFAILRKESREALADNPEKDHPVL
ncbi:hypothetical protein HPO96_25020 [Kribbella sandramycini]|uniref:Integral membrane protein n=1 Tax=Kribbella sandramycini TaxID=60450 RepID=A0A7Y4L4X7_9ACTN|nr:hypothetical protein [Kribbella sandramycini]MBB6571080.1 hypothetical protein [Kribbella sandramycini]NOL43511.1 hypothetical protein [Kribbella sandramycini]